MRAIFTSFDNFMAVFVAMFALAWSTVFMPLLGGPLHTYEAQAIGAGWQSLRSGEAASIEEALEIASSIPVQAVFPSAHAAEMTAQPMQVAAMPGELLGGPDPILVTAPVPHRVPDVIEVRPLVIVEGVPGSACEPSGHDACVHPQRPI